MDAELKLRHQRRQRGQSLIEMIFILPLIVTLMIWLMQGVEVVRASHEQQKYLRLDLMLRLNNQAKYTVDYIGPRGLGPRVATRINPNKNSMVVEYSNISYSQKSLAGNLEDFRARVGAPIWVRSKLGICLRPVCN
jgi:hypothetical protein